MAGLHHGGNKGVDAGADEDRVEDELGEQLRVARIKAGAQIGGEKRVAAQGVDAIAAVGHSGDAAEGMVCHYKKIARERLREETEVVDVAGKLRGLQNGGALGEGGADDVGSGGDARHAHLSLRHQALQLDEEVVLGEDAEGCGVHEEDVDVVCLQLTQAGVKTGAKERDGELVGGEELGGVRARDASQAREERDGGAGKRPERVLPGARGGQNAELGAEDNLGAAGTAELSEERLGCAVSVGARGVEEVDARVVCGGQSGKGLAAGGAAHHGGTAETEDGERGATDGKRDVTHTWTTLTRCRQDAG